MGSELEKLKANLQKITYSTIHEGGDNIISAYEAMELLDAALASEKQRVCANCKYSYVSITNDLIAGEDCYAENTDYPKVLDPQGYCHKWASREATV